MPSKTATYMVYVQKRSPNGAPYWFAATGLYRFRSRDDALAYAIHLRVERKLLPSEIAVKKQMSSKKPNARINGGVLRWRDGAERWPGGKQLLVMPPDRCARCLEPRHEHAYSGACYGRCGQYVDPLQLAF